MALSSIIVRTVHAAQKRARRLVSTRDQIRATRILQNTRTPRVYDHRIRDIQSQCVSTHNYLYDPFSLWERARDRFQELCDADARMKTPGLSIAEVGCGDAVLSGLFQWFGHHAEAFDFSDWRTGPGENLPVTIGDICNPDLQLLEVGKYDVVCSFNTFEHLQSVEIASTQIEKSLKPGGTCYLHFGPLYSSAWGLHARCLTMPYPQFLFTQDAILTQMNELGHNDLNGTIDGELQPLNKLLLRDYYRIFDEVFPGCTVAEVRNDAGLWAVLEYSDAFSGRGLTLDDVLVQGLIVKYKKAND